MAEGAYSAGSIFLQVVPSFNGFEAAARRTAKKMEGIFADSMDQAGERGANKARKHMDDALGGSNAKNSANAHVRATAPPILIARFSAAAD